MKISIKNCNNIDFGEIEIASNALNIKYGINGTGKSTISKAIQYEIAEDKDLNELKPFKYINSTELDFAPKINGLEETKSIMIFDEEFIDKFVFKEDEVIDNSFEIFLKDEEFKKQADDIEKFVEGIHQEINTNENIKNLKLDMINLSLSFGKKSTKTGINKSSTFYKSLADGNKLENIPEDVSQYKTFLKSESNTKWITWQAKGNEFIDIGEHCPYCASEIENKKDDIKKIAITYKPKNFEHLVEILKSVEKLGEYFSPESEEKIIKIVKNKTGISPEEELILKQIKEQIDLLIDKIEKLESINYMSFRDDEKVIDKITNLEIDLSLLNHLDSEKTRQVTDGVNSALSKIKKEIIGLQKNVGIQRAYVNKLIEKNKTDINNFLRNAGYKYQVFFDKENENFPMKLKHIDSDNTIENGKSHLSYGEKNAFAMLLFMYQCLSKSPDIIVLDDPISSFDKNKKYAIMRKLFVEKNSLKNKTVLMLTHDFDPIVDFFKILPLTQNNTASYIYNKGGQLKEKPINKCDILTFIEVCDINILNSENTLIKLIYLRRKLDAINDYGDAYQIISNIIHKRNLPIYNDETEMGICAIQNGTNDILKKIKDFNYKECVETVKNNNRMKELYYNAKNDYERLQLFRILTDKINLENNYLQKYINEVFHIENDKISQLDPNKYELVPDFVINECNKFIGTLTE